MRRFLKFALSGKDGVREAAFVRGLKRYFHDGKIFVMEFKPRGRKPYCVAVRRSTPETYERLFKVRLAPVGRLWKVSDEGVVPSELAAVVDWINIVARFRAE